MVLCSFHGLRCCMSNNSNNNIFHNSIEHFLCNLSDSFSDDVLSCLWIVFTNSVFQVAPQKIVRQVEILIRLRFRHNAPWDRLISRQTDNTGHPIPNISTCLRGYLKDRICENNPQTRQDIIREGIRQIAQEMLNRVVDNFIVRVVAVLPYSSAVHGKNIVLITEKV